MRAGILFCVVGALLLGVVPFAEAVPLNIGFENPPYSIGPIAGQDGWTGAGTVVGAGSTRLGGVAGSQSVEFGPDMGRNVSSGIESGSITPFSFLWDWSADTPGPSRFAEFEFQVSGTRVARFGADLSGLVNTRYYGYTIENGGNALSLKTEFGVQFPIVQVEGFLNFSTSTYDLRFTNLNTNTSFALTALQMSTQPGLAAAQANTVFTTTASIEGIHYLDNLSVGGPPPSAFTWSNTSNNWNQAENWFPGGVPNDSSQAAVFGNSITSPETVYTNSAVTVKSIQFGVTDDSGASQSYTIAGPGGVILDAPSGNAAINVIDGTHQFQTPVSLSDNTGVNVGASSSLTFNNALNLNGHTLTKTGTGSMAINNILNTGGGTVALSAGILGGSGEIGGTLTNTAGIVAPGNSPGTLTVDGNFAQSAGGTLAIEIAGAGAGQNDVLDVTGSTILDGLLEISLLSFVPSPNDSFTILSSAAGITNNGLALTGDMASFFSLSLANGNTDLVLTFQASSLPGDFDTDGDVDGRDFLIWQRGGSPNQGSPADLSDWQSHYGTSNLTSTVSAVPEPASGTLLILTLAASTVLFRAARNKWS